VSAPAAAAAGAGTPPSAVDASGGGGAVATMAAEAAAAAAAVVPESAAAARRDGAWAALTARLPGLRRSAYDSQIVRIALPALASVLVDPLLTLADTLFLSRLGTVALASIGPPNAVFNAIFATASTVLTVSTAVTVAAATAREDVAAAGRTAFLAGSVAAVVAAGVVAFLAFRGAAVLTTMGATSVTLGGGNTYLRGRLWGVPASLAALVADGVCRGHGDVVTPLRIGLGVCLLNIVLDAYLMLGPPRLGLLGAAAATSAAQVVGAMAYVIVLSRPARRVAYGLTKAVRASLRWREHLPPFAVAASSVLLRQLANVGSWTASSAVVARLGVVPTAAHQLALAIWMLGGFSLEPLSIAAQILVARTVGTGGSPFPIAARLITLSLTAATTMVLFMSIVAPIALPAISSDPAVVAMARTTLSRGVLALPLCSSVWLMDGVMYGAAEWSYNARCLLLAAVVALAGLWAVSQGLFGGGITGVWMVMTFLFFGVRAIGHAWRVFGSKSGVFAAARRREQEASAGKNGGGGNGGAPGPAAA